MEMLIALISILAITGAISRLNRFLQFKICPICLGVSGTWLGLSAMVLSGQLPMTDYQLLIAILMGGSVVGIAYQGEKRFIWAQESIFRFKVPATVIGFTLAYLALQNLSWIIFGIEVAVLTALAYLFFIKLERGSESPEELRRVAELEKKMEKCC